MFKGWNLSGCFQHPSIFHSHLAVSHILHYIPILYIIPVLIICPEIRARKLRHSSPMKKNEPCLNHISNLQNRYHLSFDLRWGFLGLSDRCTISDTHQRITACPTPPTFFGISQSVASWPFIFYLVLRHLHQFRPYVPDNNTPTPPSEFII